MAIEDEAAKEWHDNGLETICCLDAFIDFRRQNAMRPNAKTSGPAPNGDSSEQ